MVVTRRGHFFHNRSGNAKCPHPYPARCAPYDSAPLVARAISVNILLGLYEAAERVVGDAGAITVPTLMLVSGSDWVVHHAPQHAFFDGLGSPVK